MQSHIWNWKNQNGLIFGYELQAYSFGVRDRYSPEHPYSSGRGSRKTTSVLEREPELTDHISGLKEASNGMRRVLFHSAEHFELGLLNQVPEGKEKPYEHPM